MSGNRDDFRKKILSVFLFFLVFGMVAYSLVFFTGKPSSPQLGETEKPRENPDAMTDPATGRALTYSLGTDGGVTVKERHADEEAEKAEDRPAPAETPEKKAEPVKAPAPQAAPQAQAKPAPQAVAPEKKPEAPKAAAPKPAAPAPVPKPAETKAPAAAAKPAPVKAGMYVLQLAAYRSEAAADAEINRLRKTFPDIYSVRIDLGDKGVWYRLRCSPSATYEEAVKKRDAVNQKHGFKAIVVKSEL